MYWILVVLVPILMIGLIFYTDFKLYKYFIKNGWKKGWYFSIAGVSATIPFTMYILILGQYPIKLGWQLLILLIAGLLGALIGYMEWLGSRYQDEDYKKEQELINKNPTGFKKAIIDIVNTLLIIIAILTAILTFYFIGH